MTKKPANCLNLDRFNPYGSMDGLAFKTNGGDDDRAYNLSRALSQLREWCVGAGNREDVATAVNHLWECYPALRSELRIIKGSFVYDEAFEGDIIRMICTVPFNKIGDRLGENTRV